MPSEASTAYFLEWKFGETERRELQDTKLSKKNLSLQGKLGNAREQKQTDIQSSIIKGK